jgi:flavin reductase (DIM6/NTAB) family NADH-FMN oxidoreductase RutF
MEIDRQTFLEVMTCFPTGVCVITTVDGQGRPFGLTSNAVASVSADPPTLLACIAKTSRSLPALLERKGFLVNFMGLGSEEVCGRFASTASSKEKFAATRWQTSDRGHPLLVADAIAYADCETHTEVEVGSHLIVVGRVQSGAVTDLDRTPVSYFRRGYRRWAADDGSGTR